MRPDPRSVRMTPAVIVAAALVIGSLPRADAQEPCLYREYSAVDMATILENEGYGSVHVEGNRVSFKAEGSGYLLILYDGGDLQLFYGLSGVRITPAHVNEWNRTRRLARAYIDTSGVPVLESDLPSFAGLNAEMVTGFVRLFVQTLAPEFRSFVTSRSRP